jgi:hypothetical protein
MNLRAMIAKLEPVAAFKFDNAPSGFCRDPLAGMALHSSPFDNDEKLVPNRAQLHAVLQLVAHDGCDNPQSGRLFD